MVAVAACSWGTWRYILLGAERFAPGLDARLESAVVMLVITVFSFGVLRWGGSWGARGARARRTRRDWLAVGWLGVADALNVLLLFAAYGRTSVAIAVTTHYLAPILVAVGAPLLLREHARGAWMAAFGGAVGLFLLLRPWSGTLERHDVMGALAGAGSAVFYASNVFVNRTLVRSEPKFTAVELMAFHGVVATPLLFAMTPWHVFHSLDVPGALMLALGGIGPGALGGILFIKALESVRASHASTLTLLEPLVAVGIAVTFRGEELRVVSAFGAALVLLSAVGVAYVHQRA